LPTTAVPATTVVNSTTSAQDASSPVQFVWKTSGDAAKPLSGAFSVAVDNQGNIYVGLVDVDQVQKLDSNGKFLASWGKTGSGDGDFMFKSAGNTEVALALDAQDNVYVSDLNRRIQKFDANGKFLLKWGSQGDAEGQFQGSIGLATDSQGNVYVSDIFNNVIQKFDANGKFLLKWGSTGSNDGQFKKVAGIAIDKQGNLYAVDNGLNRVQKFDANGKFVAKWDSSGQFNGLTGVAVDSQNNVYVCDQVGTVQKLDSQGKVLGRWGGKGSGDGEFNIPTSLAVDKQGNVYVADWMNNRVQKFRPR